MEPKCKRGKGYVNRSQYAKAEQEETQKKRGGKKDIFKKTSEVGNTYTSRTPTNSANIYLIYC